MFLPGRLRSLYKLRPLRNCAGRELLLAAVRATPINVFGGIPLSLSLPRRCYVVGRDFASCVRFPRFPPPSARSTVRNKRAADDAQVDRNAPHTLHALFFSKPRPLYGGYDDDIGTLTNGGGRSNLDYPRPRKAVRRKVI